MQQKLAASSDKNKRLAKEANEKIKARIAVISELKETVAGLEKVRG